MTREDIIEHNKRWFQKVYNSIIERGKQRGYNKSDIEFYTEVHHILPRCLGGKDDKENLVLLSYREHYICHLLLCRIYPNSLELSQAAYLMINLPKRKMYSERDTIINSRIAEECRLQSIEYLKKINLGERNPMYGKHISEEHKQILSKVNSHPKSESMRQKLVKANLGKKASEETKKKLSESHKGKRIHSDERKEYLSKKWTGKNNPNFEKDLSGENNPSSKKVIDTNTGIIYPSQSAAAKALGIGKDTVRIWIKETPEKGLQHYIENNTDSSK